MSDKQRDEIHQVGQEIARAREEIEKTLAQSNVSGKDMAALQEKFSRLYARYSALVQARGGVPPPRYTTTTARHSITSAGPFAVECAESSRWFSKGSVKIRH